MYSKYAWSRTTSTWPGTAAKKRSSSSRVFAVAVGERGPQRVHAAVGVAVELAHRPLDRLDRRRERRERALVRRELHDAVEAELALHLLDGLAGLVRDEIGDRAPEELAHSSG